MPGPKGAKPCLNRTDTSQNSSLIQVTSALWRLKAWARQVWYVVPALERLKRRLLQSEASLGYRVRAYLPLPPKKAAEIKLMDISGTSLTCPVYCVQLDAVCKEPLV